MERVEKQQERIDILEGEKDYEKRKGDKMGKEVEDAVKQLKTFKEISLIEC